MTGAVLVLNAGSSSLKFAVYGGDHDLPLRLKGALSRLRHAPRLRVEADGDAIVDRPFDQPMALTQAADAVFAQIDALGWLPRIGVVGHRIVHGGRAFVDPTVLDPESIGALRRLTPLAPLHQPYNLDIAESAARLLPHAVQVGCFDTAFHADRPALDRLYALPGALSEDGVVAYGFHGLSYAHIAGVLRTRDGERAGGRAIVAHLGSGASLCAMSAGRSVATTMGFSALEGLVMSSRCGSLDPGVLLHLLQDRGMSPQDLTRLLYEESGLLGVSGISGDMQTLLDSDDPRAAEAVDLFVYRIGREIGSLAAALGGLDTLVFTAGIGENAPAVRWRIGQAAAWLGLRIDEARNARGEAEITGEGSAAAVLVVPTDEERAVAGAAARLWRERSV